MHLKKVDRKYLDLKLNKMEDKELLYRSLNSSKEFNFTAKGRNILITLKNGKRTTAKVEKCSGSYADVKLNNRIVLINSSFNEV